MSYQIHQNYQNFFSGWHKFTLKLLISLGNKELRKVKTWLDSNKLALNFDKTILGCSTQKIPCITSYLYSLKIVKLLDAIYINVLAFVNKTRNKHSPVYCHNYLIRKSYFHGLGTYQATRGDLFTFMAILSRFKFRYMHTLLISILN